MTILTEEFYRTLTDQIVRINKKLKNSQAPVLPQSFYSYELVGSSFTAGQVKEYSVTVQRAGLGDFCRVSFPYQPFFQVACEIRTSGTITLIVTNTDASIQSILDTKIFFIVGHIPETVS